MKVTFSDEQWQKILPLMKCQQNLASWLKNDKLTSPIPELKCSQPLNQVGFVVLFIAFIGFRSRIFRADGSSNVKHSFKSSPLTRL